MVIEYYYSDCCQCCKGYESTVERVAFDLKTIYFMKNVDKEQTDRELNGVPAIYIVDELTDKVLFYNVGNLEYDKLIEKIREALNE